MTALQNFNALPFIEALKGFFEALHIPINHLSDLPAKPESIFGDAFNPINPAHALIDELYVLGLINDSIFTGSNDFDSLETIKKMDKDYDGLLIFGITLHAVGGLPTRSQLTEITRIFNRAFPYTPVTIVFKYDHYLSFANSERVKYLQEWREGEKIGKVSLLRDIDLNNLHAGHERILTNLAIARSGKNAVNSFDELYKYWQGVLSVSILNKAFYGELQNWYFWAIQEVHFPNPPLRIDFSSDNDFDEALKEHKGKNVIRLLTRILFIWFVKEKGLIPEEIFDEKIIADTLLHEFVPQKPMGIFATGNKQNSKYYRAILQNLFFATLNQPCQKRTFRTDGQHQNTTQLMRYRSYFKDADYFVGLMEAKVPFMNGGLFECLDKPHPTAKGKQGGDRIIYVDGFSDRADNDLLVPDYLFFDADEEVDLSNDLGNAKFKKSKTRGLTAILKSYKFTITENTPIDEDIALDPELLGKVFENLLASYNPETKTTARKQTGSFYTPREIVDYMVDESLIAYLKNELLQQTPGVVEFGKNQISLFGNEVKKGQLSFEDKVENNPLVGNEDKLDGLLHQLVAYGSSNPFANDETTQKKLIKALDNCKILDPACGSGAYPMGILQKMVHILHKIDPNNTEWKNRQLKRVNNAIVELEQLDDTTLRENTIRDLEAQKTDIEEAFANNELDYGRKLYLIENCIFGVDIQPIATQISKLRFFISLVVDQKVDASKENFGIRPLPNLETKFVAANTLIGIEKPINAQTYLFDRTEVKTLENQLKKVRQRLFSAKTPATKRSLREQDKTLREAMGSLLADQYGDATARQLANWDPYDQNSSSPFFDKEWMFGVADGFDIVIGNPPYGFRTVLTNKEKDYFRKIRKIEFSSGDSAELFVKICFDNFVKNEGILSFIIPKKSLYGDAWEDTRINYWKKYDLVFLLDTGKSFDNVLLEASVFGLKKDKPNNHIKLAFLDADFKINEFQQVKVEQIFVKSNTCQIYKVLFPNSIFDKIQSGSFQEKMIDGKLGLAIGTDFFSDTPEEFKLLKGIDVTNYKVRGHRWLANQDKLKWSNVQEFLKPKVITQVIVSHIENPVPHLKITAAFDKEGIAITNTLMAFDIDSRLSNEFWLAYLNSKFLSWYAYNFIYARAIRTMHFYNFYIQQIPIPQISPEAQLPFIDLVDKILLGKELGQDTAAWEAEIDALVYGLYDLTAAEIAVVQNTPAG